MHKLGRCYLALWTFFLFLFCPFDISANVIEPPDNLPVTDFTVFSSSDVPTTTLANDAQSVEVGVKLRSSEPGLIKAIRYYKGMGTTGVHIGHIWTASGVLLATATFLNETGSGWQETVLDVPVILAPDVTIIASVFSPSGDYAFTPNYFTVTAGNGPIKAIGDGIDGSNGIYSYSTASTFPTASYNASNYFVDVVFAPGVLGGILNGSGNFIPKFVSPVQLQNSLLFDNGVGIGIGTTAPGSYKLAVDGTIGARKLKVTQETWADYVFASDYDLISIDSVEQFIRRNKHLPGVPSAIEIFRDSLDVGGNQAVLLKKIEELTLYIIDLNKELKELEILRKELNDLKLEIRGKTNNQQSKADK